MRKEHFEQVQATSIHPKQRQRDGVVYGPAFIWTCISALLAVDAKSKVDKDWERMYLTLASGTPPEILLRMRHFAKSDVCVWGWKNNCKPLKNDNKTSLYFIN